jgi:hypothetical protein
VGIVAWKPNIPALEDILGSTPAKVLMDILCDYAYKSTPEWTDNNKESEFALDDEMYLKRASQAILMYVSVNRENLSRNITKLKNFGVLQAKATKSKAHPQGINKYKPYIGTDLYIKLAKEKLLDCKEEYAKLRIQEFISCLEECETQIIFDAFGIKHTFKVKKKAPLQRD